MKLNYSNSKSYFFSFFSAKSSNNSGFRWRHPVGIRYHPFKMANFHGFGPLPTLTILLASLLKWYTRSASPHRTESGAHSWREPRGGTNNCTTSIATLRTYCPMYLLWSYHFTAIETKSNFSLVNFFITINWNKTCFLALRTLKLHSYNEWNELHKYILTLIKWHIL